MALLVDVAKTGFNGLAITAVDRKSAETLSHDNLLGAIPVMAQGIGTNVGSPWYRYDRYPQATATAQTRKIGEGYDENCILATPVNAELKAIGNAFNVDRAQQRMFQNNDTLLANWVEGQLRQGYRIIAETFSKEFIGSNTTAKVYGDHNASKFVTDMNSNYTMQIVGPINDSNYIDTERQLLEVMNTVSNGNPNFIVTTPKGKSLLQALNMYNHRGIEAITVGNVNYASYMGMPIAVLPEAYFGEATLPVYFMDLNEDSGVSLVIPSDGKLVDLLMPSFSGGRLVEPGSIDMWAVPVFRTENCVSKLSITETPATT